jgi:hypothetical protein
MAQARDSNGRFASGGGGGGRGSRGPKTAAGRAGANLRAAQKARSANPYDKKAANKLITAQAAKDYYKTFGGGRKGAAKPMRAAVGRQPMFASPPRAAAPKAKAPARPRAKTPAKAAAPKAAPKAKAAAKMTVAERKKALIRDASAKVLAGQKVSASRLRYISAQQQESQRQSSGGRTTRSLSIQTYKPQTLNPAPGSYARPAAAKTKAKSATRKKRKG